MSKYIDEIIKDIKTNPSTYKDFEGYGIEKAGIRISQFGNTRMLSIINVEINGKKMPTSYIDLWRLETAIKWRYRTIDLKVLIN